MPKATTELTVPPTRALYTVAEAVVLLNYSRAKVFELIRAGRLETVSEGRSRRVPADAITAYIELLKTEAKEARSAEAA
jgi:excisionase family DNA binding protein